MRIPSQAGTTYKRGLRMENVKARCADKRGSEPFGSLILFCVMIILTRKRYCDRDSTDLESEVVFPVSAVQDICILQTVITRQGAPVDDDPAGVPRSIHA